MSIFSRPLDFVPHVRRGKGPYGTDQHLVVVWSTNPDGSESIVDIMECHKGSDAHKVFHASGDRVLGIMWQGHMLELQQHPNGRWMVTSATARHLVQLGRIARVGKKKQNNSK